MTGKIGRLYDFDELILLGTNYTILAFRQESKKEYLYNTTAS